MATLHGAVPLAQMNDIAVAVREHLKLDVPRALQEFLHVDLVVAERRQRLGLGDVDGIQQRGFGCAPPACRVRRRRRRP